MTPLIETIRPHDLTPPLAAEITALAKLIWPGDDTPGDPAFRFTQWQQRQTAHFVIRENDVLQAHACLFPREIITARGPLLIGALATVCVHPTQRGRGWGAAIVRAAFDYLPQLNTEISLFQTGVPQFYEKLGARIVTNHFFDGTRADGIKTNPFADKCEMIYPATFDWPDGEIDLNGPGY